MSYYFYNGKPVQQEREWFGNRYKTASGKYATNNRAVVQFDKLYRLTDGRTVGFRNGKYYSLDGKQEYKLRPTASRPTTKPVINYTNVAKSYGLNTPDEIKQTQEELNYYTGAGVQTNGVWDQQADQAYTDWLTGISKRVSETNPMEGIQFQFQQTFKPTVSFTNYLTQSPLSTKKDIDKWVKSQSWGKYINTYQKGGNFALPKYRDRVTSLGLKSRDDVKAYQRKLGVKDDGVWGDQTNQAYTKSLKRNRTPLKQSMALIDWNTQEQIPQFQSEKELRFLNKESKTPI